MGIQLTRLLKYKQQTRRYWDQLKQARASKLLASTRRLRKLLPHPAPSTAHHTHLISVDSNRDQVVQNQHLQARVHLSPAYSTLARNIGVGGGVPSWLSHSAINPRETSDAPANTKDRSKNSICLLFAFRLRSLSQLAEPDTCQSATLAASRQTIRKKVHSGRR
jgi:hypothetical protein